MNGFDKSLPIILDSHLFTINDSLSLELFTRNQTNHTNLATIHHPILYGIALYALFLIIIGTIGKRSSNLKITIEY